MSIEAALRLTRVHAYRNAGRVNQEIDRLAKKLRDERFADLDRRSAALARQMKAAPELR